MSKEFLDRNEILGNSKDYGFDRVLRGYDVKQVEAYIENLLQADKNATAMFDSRLTELKNENSMLECELLQIKSDLSQMKTLYTQCSQERDKLKSEQKASNTSASDVKQEEYKELEEKYNKLVSKNRLLTEKNKELEDEKRNLQRDIAHLAKKVDKNRIEIKNLNEQLEAGCIDSENINAKIANIYKSSIDKAEDLIYRLQTEFSIAHSKAEDVKEHEEN